MKLKIVKGKIKLFSRGVGFIESPKQLFDAYYWRMRCYRHKRWEKFSHWAIKTLAMALLKRSSIYYRHVKRYGHAPRIEKLVKTYKSQHFHSLNGEYVTDWNHYTMGMHVSEYTFWGNYEYEIYLEIIRLLILRGIMFPYCTKGGPLGTAYRFKHRNDIED